MELNALYFHHQTTIMQHANPRADGDCQSQFDMIDHYAKRIDAERRRMGYGGHHWLQMPASGQTGLAGETAVCT